MREDEDDWREWDREYYLDDDYPGVSGKTLSGEAWFNRKKVDEQRSFSGIGPKGYIRSDERIYEDVNERLTMSPRIDASEIQVTVEKGCVYLKGTVDSRQTKKNAELEVEYIPGVTDVQNLLTFRPTERKDEEMPRPRFQENLVEKKQ